jgi:hypothetical protein
MWLFPDFETKKGFQFAYTLAKFVLQTFEEDGLNRFIRQPDDFQSAFGMSETEFRSRWTQFLKENYA